MKFYDIMPNFTGHLYKINWDIYYYLMATNFQNLSLLRNSKWFLIKNSFSLFLNFEIFYFCDHFFLLKLTLSLCIIIYLEKWSNHLNWVSFEFCAENLIDVQKRNTEEDKKCTHNSYDY